MDPHHDIAAPPAPDTAFYAFRDLPRAPPRNRLGAVLDAFTSTANVARLRQAFGVLEPSLRVRAADRLGEAVRRFAEQMGRAILADDPLARRGEASRSTSAGGELARLNRAFVQDRLKLLEEGGELGGEEPYHMRAFTSDSLRPPGLENLNGSGPLFAIREDQAERSSLSMAADFAGHPGLAEYFEGFPAVATEYARQRAAPSGEYETRFTRYPEIPIWRNLSRGRNYDRDIGETLGAAPVEMGCQTRRWGRGDGEKRYLVGPRQ